MAPTSEARRVWFRTLEAKGPRRSLPSSGQANILHAGVACINEQLASIHVETAVQDDARRVVAFYHEVIFKPSIGNSLKVGVEREMETLAVAHDSLLEGPLGRTGDLLIARYKAPEESVRSGHWDVVAELVAVPVREDSPQRPRCFVPRRPRLASSSCNRL